MKKSQDTLLSIKVKTNAREEKVEKRADGTYKAWVKASPEKGRANEALIKLLAEHFNVPRAAITIRSGHTAQYKKITLST